MEQMSIQPEPVDFNGLSYSPALLLDGRLSTIITDDPGFPYSCKWGFIAFFEEMEEDGPKVRTVESVKAVIRVNMRNDDHPLFGRTPLVARVGVSLGWLSALALAQYEEAKEGLGELLRLLERL